MAAPAAKLDADMDLAAAVAPFAVDSIIPSTPTAPLSSFQSLLDFPGGGAATGASFLDLLSLPDFPAAMFNFDDHPPSSPPPSQPPAAPPCHSVNSASASLSASSSGDGGPTTPVGDEADDQSKQQKQLKSNTSTKKAAQKRSREPRFAFKTRSDVDHLEDGYRWRKYGQKAVKNSPYPRSYYRCTAAACGVKKLIERSADDPAVVVTTYEGKHTHPSPPTLSARGAAYSATPGGAMATAHHHPLAVRTLGFSVLHPSPAPSSPIFGGLYLPTAAGAAPRMAGRIHVGEQMAALAGGGVDVDSGGLLQDVIISSSSEALKGPLKKEEGA